MVVSFVLYHWKLDPGGTFVHEVGLPYILTLMLFNFGIVLCDSCMKVMQSPHGFKSLCIMGEIGLGKWGGRDSCLTHSEFSCDLCNSNFPPRGLCHNTISRASRLYTTPTSCWNYSSGTLSMDRMEMLLCMSFRIYQYFRTSWIVSPKEHQKCY